MPVHDLVAQRLRDQHHQRLAIIKASQSKRAEATAALAPKRGAEIFAGTDYPHTFAGFVGQAAAVQHLQAVVASAAARNVRLDHTLLASGLHGIGKTTLALLLAAETGVGITCVSGALTVDDAREVLTQMSDGDILFWDEVHLAVAGNRNRADWVLPLLTDGVLLTKQGREPMPNITVVAATTDLGKLPQTLISRFMVRPKLVPYTAAEAQSLVVNLAERMGVYLDPDDVAPIARAANHNPRDIRMVLTAYRDAAATSGAGLDLVFEWAGVTADGLSAVAVDMLVVLLDCADYTASIDSIGAKLGEPGPLRHHEQQLLQRGLVDITGRGRKLTEDGITRALQALSERTA